MGEKISKLLINETPLQVLPSLVIALGGSKYLLDAIFLQQIKFWLSNSHVSVEIDGEKYVPFSYAEWSDQIPWVEIETLKSVVARLKERNILIVIQPAGMDKTNHYSINYAALTAILGLHDDPAQGGNDDPAQGGDGCPAQGGDGCPAQGGDVLLIKESIKTLRKKPKQKTEAESETYLEFEKMKHGKANWKYRDEFLAIGAEMTALADLCVQRFGQPENKKDLILWFSELTKWLQAGVTPADWKPALKIIDGYSNPVLTITGMTKAIQYTARMRKNEPGKREIFRAEDNNKQNVMSIEEARKKGIIK